MSKIKPKGRDLWARQIIAVTLTQKKRILQKLNSGEKEYIHEVIEEMLDVHDQWEKRVREV